jgi:hypothetical protein
MKNISKFFPVGVVSGLVAFALRFGIGEVVAVLTKTTMSLDSSLMGAGVVSVVAAIIAMAGAIEFKRSLIGIGILVFGELIAVFLIARAYGMPELRPGLAMWIIPDVFCVSISLYTAKLVTDRNRRITDEEAQRNAGRTGQNRR